MRPLVSSIAVLALLLVAAPAAAKEVPTAELDRAIPIEGKPGTTVDVGFTLEFPVESAVARAAPLLRVHPVGGRPITVSTHQDRAGHYVAQFGMPEHGIAMLEMGIPDEACGNTSCGPLYVALVGPGGSPALAATVAATTVPASGPPASPAAPAQRSSSDSGLPVVLALVVIAAGVAGLLVGRRIAGGSPRAA